MALTDEEAITAVLLRPLTEFETSQLDELITQAENALRTRMPAIDDRLEAFAADAKDPVGINPLSVRRVLAGVIKRKLANPDGAASKTNARGDGPFTRSTSVSFASYGRAIGDGTPGELEVTDADLAALVARTMPMPATIRTAAPALPSDPFEYACNDTTGTGC